jgi:hypothetical protein
MVEMPETQPRMLRSASYFGAKATRVKADFRNWD